MAELPHLGAHCNADHCNLLDFLPFDCIYCGRLFCLNHRIPSSHNCPNEPQSTLETIPDATTDALTLYCQLEGCSKGEIFPVICLKCHKNFCLHHRHYSDHNCEGLHHEQEVEQKRVLDKKNEVENAMKEFKKLPNIAAKSTSKPQGHKSDETAMKVKLMKMKMKAVGPSGVPENDKVYFNIQLPKEHSSKEEISVYFDMTWSIGKSIDWLTNLEKIINSNNIPDAEKIQFYFANYILPLSSSWRELLVSMAKDGFVSGSQLCLEYERNCDGEKAVVDVTVKEVSEEIIFVPSPYSKPQSKSNETAVKLKLMKMKFKAKGPSGVTENDKVFFTIKLPERHTINREVIVYFKKSWSVGKSIDWLADMEKICNTNNVPGAEKLQLFGSSSSLSPFSTWNELLVSQMENGLVSGDTLTLEYHS